MIDVSHHRSSKSTNEDDTADVEPAAKRIRTDAPRPAHTEPQFKVPEVPAPAATSPEMANGDTAASTSATTDGDDTVTQHAWDI